MTHFWLLITFSWLNTVSLQHVISDGSGVGPAEQIQHYSMPYMSFLNVPSRNKFDHSGEVQNSNEYNQFYHRDNVELQDNVRKRRSDTYRESDTYDALPNLDIDKTVYLTNSERLAESPFALQEQTNENNGSDVMIGSIQKRSFSPWGGKRNEPTIENMWSWKRTSNVREPSMPKRVRFSPWGGKRSDNQLQMMGSKGSKVILSSYIPEITRTRILSKYLPKSNRLSIAGYHLIPSIDKRHPIRVLVLNTKLYDIDRAMKYSLPYNRVNLKKDGKRKVKFSTWGGKRAAILIGPNWSKSNVEFPSVQGLRDSTLKALLLLRNNAVSEQKPIMAL